MNCATHNDVAAVAFCRTCGKPLCNQCTRDVRGVIYCEACLASRMEGSAPAAPGYTPVQTAYQQVMDQGLGMKVPPRPASGPNPALAGILGAIPFGIGAVYNGQYAKGLAHLAIFVFLWVGSAETRSPLDVVLGIGVAFFWIYQIIDAVRSAHAIQAGQPAPDPFGLAQTFGTGEKLETTKLPIGAAILIGLGVLFLLHTAGFFEFGIDRFWPLILVGLGVWMFAKQWGLLGGSPTACQCDRCRSRRLMGPAITVTLGILFLLDNTTSIEFHKTWPAILLVVGVVKLLQSNASSAGHTGRLPRNVHGGPPNIPPPPATPNSGQPTSSDEVKNV
jgi:hypothetical protein